MALDRYIILDQHLGKTNEMNDDWLIIIQVLSNSNIYLFFFNSKRGEINTSLIHMSEFYMIEAEESFIESIEDITNRLESAIKSVTRHLLNNRLEEIVNCKKNCIYTTDWLDKKFHVLPYLEASEILKKNSSKFVSGFQPGSDLAKQHELFLVQHIGSPVFIINWPKDLKPFYMRQCPENSDLVNTYGGKNYIL